jgi:hypothetical protein
LATFGIRYASRAFENEAHTVAFDQLPTVFADIIDAKAKGRTVIDIAA